MRNERVREFVKEFILDNGIVLAILVYAAILVLASIPLAYQYGKLENSLRELEYNTDQLLDSMDSPNQHIEYLTDDVREACNTVSEKNDDLETIKSRLQQ